MGHIDVSAVGDRKLKVFISYSRKDEDFAQDLLAGLELVAGGRNKGGKLATRHSKAAKRRPN